MCSRISMPADYEMLISHSPPILCHTSSRFLTECLPYSSIGFQSNNRPNIVSITKIMEEEYAASISDSPRRSCLILRPDKDASTNCPKSPATKAKKRVVFADDRGKSLTQIRIMSEPSNVPPYWSQKFLAQLTKGLTADIASDLWEVMFVQPASDYVEFRRKLDQDQVSLENVIVRKAEECMFGTIKVKNFSFQKEVFVRTSFNQWTTYEDVFCNFVDNNSATNSGVNGYYVLYDTFSFRLVLPKQSNQIEFCICFRCEGQEYWDNNFGKNYLLLKRNVYLPPTNTSAKLLFDDADNTNVHNTYTNTKYTDALHAKIESWSEFASWNHLENNVPYW